MTSMKGYSSFKKNFTSEDSTVVVDDSNRHELDKYLIEDLIKITSTENNFLFKLTDYGKAFVKRLDKRYKEFFETFTYHDSRIDVHVKNGTYNRYKKEGLISVAGYSTDENVVLTLTSKGKNLINTLNKNAKR